MTNLLRKLFIKNYQDVENPKIRLKHGFLASFVGIFSNLILFVFKLLIGLITFSISIITDAINNLTDMASCVVNVVSFKISGKPADKEHPYGHERIEYIAGLIISFIILVIAVVLGIESVQKIIRNEGSNPTVWTFIILGTAILVKLWQGFFYKKISKLINSVSLAASSQDSINDVISTGAVLLAAIIEFVLIACDVSIGVSIDGIMGLAVSLFIVVMGVKMVIETANPLIGITPDSEMVKTIVHDILSYDGVLGVHDILAHSYGPTKIFMTIHVEVDASVDVMISHDLIDNIENEINNKHNILLTIHMDPIVTNSPEINFLKEETNRMLNAYDPDLCFHDFRIVIGPTHTNVLFDVVVPYKKTLKEEEILAYLKQKFKKIKDSYILVVKFDKEYV